ncbi:hypothetical protein GIB67_036549 [Kingdonia uniflora]|uniref:Protein FAR1-RELATED SEQUENCE n=1 Tax=Kingdonia uniflora TaxID=39325 RepID=A0A7J7NZI0_9MAGN|nr:hypothetical protein GIB67_036549 [Kingdonia uniflora]
MAKTRSQSSREAVSRRIKQLYDELVMSYFGSVNLNGPPLPPREASYDGMCEAEAVLWREDFHLHCQIQTVILHLMASRVALVTWAREWVGKESFVKFHSGRAESFELQIDLEKLNGNYGCKLFKYVGLPCCHLLKVFSKYDILKIPKAFIMTRWTIGANNFSRSYDESQLERDNLRHALRHNHLSHRASNLFKRASKMKESFDFAALKLDELKSYLQNYDDTLTHIDKSQQNISTSIADSLVSRTMILSPLAVQTKGRAKFNHKKGARWKGEMEEAVMKKKRTCKSCGVLGNHDKRTFSLLKMMIAESSRRQ